MSSFGIAIDGGRYIRLDSTLRAMPKTVRLQTLKSGQTSAKLDFCAFGRNGPNIKKTIRLDGLSVREGQKAELRLRVERISIAVWVVSVSGAGISRDIRIRTGPGIWPYAVAMALLPVLMAWACFGLSLDFLNPSAPDSTPVIPHTVSDKKKAESANIPEAEINDTLETGNLKAVESVEQSDLPDSPGIITTEADRTAENSDEPVPFTPALSETATVYFSPDSARLNSRTREELERLAALVTTNYDILIEGHCAEYGTERGRLALSATRAQNVADFLAERIQNGSRIQTAGLGSSRPVTRDPDLQELNRRVEISMVSNEDP